MLDCFISQQNSTTIPIITLTTETLQTWLQHTASATTRKWVEATSFTAKSGTFCLVPNAQGDVQMVLWGVNNLQDFWIFADLPNKLPYGEYQFEWVEGLAANKNQLYKILMAWALGCYRFTAYRKPATQARSRIVMPNDIDQVYLMDLIHSIYLIRDLINTPTEDMSPQNLAEAAIKISKKFSAKITIIEGDDLLKAGYPTIHAVGRASSRKPLLIDLKWGNIQNPAVTLIGKGVCFDTGGLNIKPADGMRIMKKDMAGAAHVLGLAQFIMSQNMPLYLRVLIPAVENAISGNSIKPGDVIRTRNGVTVEISNTDAEGRLVLGDALIEAVRENPKIIIDFASLTGAARIALGPQIPAFFCNQENMAQEILAAAHHTQDLIWRLPLYAPYRDYLKSEIADISNAATDVAAGCITAALYLQTFVPEAIPWAHFDLSAWNYAHSPGRLVGGEALAFRAIVEYLHNLCQKR